MSGPTGEESFLDARWWDKMHRKHEKIIVEDKRGVRRLTGHGGWVLRWNSWVHRGPRENATIGREDMHWVCCREDVEYKRPLREYLSEHLKNSAPTSVFTLSVSNIRATLIGIFKIVIILILT